MTVFANQNTQYAFIYFFFNFRFQIKPANITKATNLQTKRFYANSRGLNLSNICQDLSNWQNMRNMLR